MLQIKNKKGEIDPMLKTIVIVGLAVLFFIFMIVYMSNNVSLGGFI